jgi:nitroreductase
VSAAGTADAALAQQAPVLRTIAERRSVRAFLERPVPRELVVAILAVSRWAPSGANMQPWDVHVLTGAAKRALSAALTDERRRGAPERPDYRYYPAEWFEPYKSRRLATGMATYAAYGARRDRASREASWQRNYDFFGAPVGLLFFIHRDLAQGSWVDYGMFLQNVMLAARAHGLETCPQASLAEYPDVVRTALGVGAERLLVGGLSLGYPDWEAAINRFTRNRTAVEEFTTFHE